MLLGIYKKSGNSSLSFLVKYTRLYRLRLKNEPKKKKKFINDEGRTKHVKYSASIYSSPTKILFKTYCFKLGAGGGGEGKEGSCLLFKFRFHFLNLGESAFKKILSLFTGLKSDHVNVQAVLPRSC